MSSFDDGFSPAEIFTLEEMLERFVYIETGDRVQDLRNPDLRDIVPMRQFVKSHRSSKSLGAPGQGYVETTGLWEHSPLRKQARVPVGMREHLLGGK